MSGTYYEQQKEVLRLLKVLSDNGVLEHVVLVGSWAEYVYAVSGILPDFTANLRTLDVDFLVKNMRRPTVPVDVAALIKEENYEIAHDVYEGTTKFLSPESGLEVEFLIPKKGAGSETVLQTNLGVVAQSLWHMSAVVNNAITANFLGMKLQVPCPEIYVLTKMIIHEERKPEKRLKDARAVQRLLPFLDYDKLNELFAASSKKEKASIGKFIEKNGEMAMDLPLDTRIKFASFVSRNIPATETLTSELTMEYL